MLVAAHSRACDAVLVWKLDRLGRSLKHLVNTLAESGSPRRGLRLALRQSRSFESGSVLHHPVERTEDSDPDRQLLRSWPAGIMGGLHSGRIPNGISFS